MKGGQLSWETPLVQFGVGAFETLRCERGCFPLEKWHRSRLTNALETWGLSCEEINEAWADLLRRGEALSEHPYRRVKLLVGLGDRDDLIHHVFDFPFEPNAESRVLKLENQLIFLPQSFKTSSYEEHYWARRRAAKEGVNDVLYVDEDRNMLEASTSCLLLWDGTCFLIRDGGPVLASSSLASLRERFPDSFKVVPDFHVDLTRDHPLLMMSALNGLAHVGRLVEEGQARALLPMDPRFLEDWNARLFSGDPS